MPTAARQRRAGARRLFASLVAVVCGWIAFAIYGQAAQGRALDARVVQLQQQNAVLQQRVDEHRREIAEAQGQAWLEEQARKLGYVMPGEHIYVISAAGQPVPSGGGVDVTLPAWSPTPAPTPAPTARPTPRPTPTPPILAVP
jgi:cell division protein FtsB